MTITNDLCRTAPFTVLRAADSQARGDGLTLAGHAAVFEQETKIDSWEGSFVETIRKGAFRKTIRERTPVMQFDHGRHPVVGSIPIGRITDLREDDDGLYVEGRLTDNWLIQPVRDAIREETIDGMSFRFEVMRQEWRDNKGTLLKDPDEINRLLWDPADRGPLVRTLIELRVPELGPVVFPAYEGTSVSVRAAAMASAIESRSELCREVRRALAADLTQLPERVADGVPDDPDLRAELARAVLFGDHIHPDAPPPDVHPSPTTEARQDAGLSHATDAPPTDEHSSDLDAPPDEGHPSQPTARQRRERYARLAYVTREGVGKQQY